MMTVSTKANTAAYLVRNKRFTYKTISEKGYYPALESVLTLPTSKRINDSRL